MPSPSETVRPFGKTSAYRQSVRGTRLADSSASASPQPFSGRSAPSAAGRTIQTCCSTLASNRFWQFEQINSRTFVVGVIVVFVAISRNFSTGLFGYSFASLPFGPARKRQPFHATIEPARNHACTTHRARYRRHAARQPLEAARGEPRGDLRSHPARHRGRAGDRPPLRLRHADCPRTRLRL